MSTTMDRALSYMYPLNLDPMAIAYRANRRRSAAWEQKGEDGTI
jgi:hypothetical protein